MRFVNIVFYGTGVLTWYIGLVLLIARLIHGPAWSHDYHDDDLDEFTERRQQSRWS